MAEPENGTFEAVANTPVTGQLTIVADGYTAESITEQLNSGELTMQATTCDEFEIMAKSTGETVAIIDNFIHEEGYFSSFDFDSFD